MTAVVIVIAVIVVVALVVRGEVIAERLKVAMMPPDSTPKPFESPEERAARRQENCATWASDRTDPS